MTRAKTLGSSAARDRQLDPSLKIRARYHVMSLQYRKGILYHLGLLTPCIQLGSEN